MKKLRIGLIGCGVISDIYLKTCQKFDLLDIAACASLNYEESSAKAEIHNIPIVCSPDEIINHPDIDSVLNLTIPAAMLVIEIRIWMVALNTMGADKCRNPGGFANHPFV